MIQKLKPNQIILVEADPNEIIIRRAKDTTRVRDDEYVAEIEEHQLINRLTAMAYAVYIGATVKIIKNYDENLKEAIKTMMEVLRD